ncbi:MAG TPA: S8 family serine peptidase [Thermoanaerobaculia bacterium]|nr:S8 family serine peptidase [Thermoanaerobaculia bacterium]
MSFPRIALVVGVLLAFAGCAGRPWRSPLVRRVYVEVEKKIVAEDYAPETGDGGPESPAPAVVQPVADRILALLGPERVDYPGAVAAYVASSRLSRLTKALDEAGLDYSLGLGREIQLPQFEIDPTDRSTRVAPGFPASFPAKPVPERFIIQFAYPVKDEWREQLVGCGVTPLAAFAQRAFLVAAPSREAITGCSAGRYLAWIDAYLTTDRVAPALLAAGTAGFTFQFAEGADLARKSSLLGPTMSLAAEGEGTGAPGFVAATANAAAFGLFARTDQDLLSASYTGVAEWSDERQGLIVAGRGGSGGVLAGPGYRQWLTDRKLSMLPNQQVVAIFDSGYDRGVRPEDWTSPDLKDHHPDLEDPERLVLLKGIPNESAVSDRLGHGTMVAGIVAGSANPITLPGPFFGGGTDARNYAYGTGIAPNAKLAMIVFQPQDLTRVDSQNRALQLVFKAGAPNGARICSQSWNQSVAGGTPAPAGLNSYDAMARYFDTRALDADVATPAKEPMTLVFSAGNFAYVYPTGPSRFNTVSSPATAKNVIAVGATSSWRPVSEGPPIACAYTNPGRPPEEDTPRADVVGAFSGRGRFFGGNTGTEVLHRTRIKPDLVAPGMRVFSTVPFGGAPRYNAPVGCKAFEPSNETGYFYTYGTGTSFAAPVVSGVAALLRKWFLDNRQNPSPALLKAAMIATADDLGHVPGQDHRPSPLYGWGRVNLDRLTDPAVQRFWNDNGAITLTTLAVRQWTRAIGDPARDLYIVLAWSDPPADVVTGPDPNAQAALVNDLNLTVELLDAAGRVAGSWYGNLFRENVNGQDTGYSSRFGTPLPENAPRDAINNVEAVFIPKNALTAGRKLRIKVKGQNVPGGPQKFALYAYNMKPNP